MSPGRQAQRDLEILTAIGEGHPLTQRALSERLGVALGLTNLYLRRLVHKGFVKVTGLRRRRVKYLLTPKGIAAKSRLTWEYMGRSIVLYRQSRATLRDALAHLSGDGAERVALYGTGEAAELAYLTLREFGLEPVAVFSAAGGGTFLGLPVHPIHSLRPGDVDRVVVATFDRPHAQMLELMDRGLPRETIVPLRPVGRLTRGRAAAPPVKDLAGGTP